MRQLLMFLAVTPGLILAIRVYMLDKIEKEPLRLLLKLAIFGAISTIPAGIAELFLGEILGFFVSENSRIYRLIDFFLIVALSEEFIKYFMLKTFTWKRQEFDFRFDGIVYAVAVSMGFAILENVSYAFSYGLGTTLMRAVTAIPGHAIFAIFMGHYYGQAKYYENYGYLDWAQRYRFYAMLVPVLLHGAYDFLASDGSIIAFLGFLLFIIVVDIVAIIKVKNFSKDDTYIKKQFS